MNAGRGTKTAALTQARDLHDLAVVQLLVEAGADVNAVDASGATLLFNLAHFGGRDDVPILEYLCQQGLNVNIANAFGAHPMIKDNEALRPLLRVLVRAGVTYIPADPHALFVKAIDDDDGESVEHLLRCCAETSWERERHREAASRASFGGARARLTGTTRTAPARHHETRGPVCAWEVLTSGSPA